MQTTAITTAARRIAREHNRHLRAGFGGSAKLVFHADGKGHCWYRAEEVAS